MTVFLDVAAPVVLGMAFALVLFRIWVTLDEISSLVEEQRKAIEREWMRELDHREWMLLEQSDRRAGRTPPP